MHKLMYLINHGWIVERSEYWYRMIHQDTGEIIENESFGLLINITYNAQKSNERWALAHPAI